MNRLFVGLNLAGIALFAVPSYLLFRFSLLAFAQNGLYDVGFAVLFLVGMVYVVFIVNCVYFIEQDRGKKDEHTP